MTDYDELSYLRQLANKQKAKIEAYKLFETTLLIEIQYLVENQILKDEFESETYKAILRLNQTLTTINNGK